MEKELTPLQALEKVKNADVYIGGDAKMPLSFTKQYRIIETALKENEKLKKLYKAELKNTTYYNNLALKYKKALEIIKDKRVDIGWLIRSENCSKYNLGVGTNQRLNTTEYNLLKEVLL